MDPEKYSLQWRSHSDHLISIMREMMMNEEFSDVTLVTEDKKLLKAHKNILSASSPVFKDMLKTEVTSKPIIFLRGIISSELEAILQFIYLGEATFCEERIDEFLAVAKSLEIKELYTAITVTKNYPVDDPLLQSKPALIPEESKEQIMQSNQSKTNEPQQISKVQREFKCEQCHKIYYSNDSLKTHIRGVHEGLTYSCDQCEFKTARGSNLKQHIKTVHEGFRFSCNQCDYQATRRHDLNQHILSVHEGVRYACDWCEYNGPHPSNLKKHVQKYHWDISGISNVIQF